jgi:hypothetical protein
LRFVEPRTPDGKGYRWRVLAGMPLSQRLNTYKDPKVEMVFVTHQALRDDVIYELAQARHNGDVTAAAQWLRSTPEGERRPAVQEVLKNAGWTFDFSMIDEGHDLLNRRGKANSAMANAIDDFTAGHEYHVSATGTPVKNDISEAFDVLHKLRPDKYPQESWDEFHRRYGMNTQGSRQAIQREMAPYVMADKIESEAQLVKHDHEITLTPQQTQLYRDVLKDYRNARKADAGSPEHVAALRKLSPESFKGVSDEQASTIARELGGAQGMLRDMALRRIIHAEAQLPAEQNAKLQHVLKTAAGYSKSDDDGKQLPGIVFAHNLESVRQIKVGLEAAGFRVGRLSGQETSLEKEQARLNFHPPVDTDGLAPVERAETQRGAAKYDILVASDAAACGANLQRAGWLYHYDQPMTAKTHEQRTGRMHRVGQLRDQVFVHNAIADTPIDHKARQRVLDKFSLSEIFQEPTELLDDTGLAQQVRTSRNDRLHNAAQDLMARMYDRK